MSSFQFTSILQNADLIYRVARSHHTSASLHSNTWWELLHIK